VACCLGSSGVTACFIKEDKVVAISAPGMLASDSDLDGDPLNAVLVSGPAHGSLTLNPEGSLRSGVARLERGIYAHLRRFRHQPEIGCPIRKISLGSPV